MHANAPYGPTAQEEGPTEALASGRAVFSEQWGDDCPRYYAALGADTVLEST